MQLNITGHRLPVTPALRTFIEEKFAKLGEHFEHITSINVILDIEKLDQIAEATIFVSKAELHASSKAEDMYAAIDTLIDKLKRQLTKYKEKHLGQRD